MKVMVILSKSELGNRIYRVSGQVWGVDLRLGCEFFVKGLQGFVVVQPASSIHVPIANLWDSDGTGEIFGRTTADDINPALP